MCVDQQFEDGEMIFRAGRPASGFYLIENGSVAIEGSVFEHGTITTDTLTAGEPLGWSWMFPPYLWHFSARATEPTTVLFFDAERLHKYSNEDLTLGHQLFRRMSQVMVQRLQRSRSKIIELSRLRFQTNNRKKIYIPLVCRVVARCEFVAS